MTCLSLFRTFAFLVVCCVKYPTRPEHHWMCNTTHGVLSLWVLHGGGSIAPSASGVVTMQVDSPSLPVPGALPTILSFLAFEGGPTWGCEHREELGQQPGYQVPTNFFSPRKPYSSPWLLCSLVSPRRVPRPPDSVTHPGCRGSGRK